MAGSRMMLTIPEQMRVAIGMLAQNDSVAPSTKARQLLRQALSRTMDSEAYRLRCSILGIHPLGGKDNSDGI